MLTRRSWLLQLALIGVATVARAGSYLDRAAVLLAGADQEGSALRSRVADLDFARVVHQLAEARVRTASEMHVPGEIAVAHPHLLLALGAHERAANAAVERRVGEFFEQLQRARDEAGVFRNIVERLGWKLPVI